MTLRKNLLSAFVASAALGAAQANAAPIFDDGLPADWNCSGTCGTAGADGVVSLAPIGGSQYGWVSTFGSSQAHSLEGIGGIGSPTNGTKLVSNFFTVEDATELQFAFNFITSDGAGYADFAWARLLNSELEQVALLFTARTLPSGSVVPGFDMPEPEATLTPDEAPIIGGGPLWSPLGTDSGSCYSAGCGYTGWILSTYDIQQAGTYALEFGVTNWNDHAYATGMAFDGITVGGVSITDPIGPVPVPEPAGLALLGLGLLALGGRRRLNK